MEAEVGETTMTTVIPAAPLSLDGARRLLEISSSSFRVKNGEER